MDSDIAKLRIFNELVDALEQAIEWVDDAGALSCYEDFKTTLEKAKKLQND